MGKKKVALKQKTVSRLHGREGLSDTKLAKTRKTPAQKEAGGTAGARKSREASTPSARKNQRGEKEVVHELVGMLVKKRRDYLKASRGGIASNTSRLVAELHEEIGEYLQAATAFVAAAQEVLEAHEVGEEEKAEKAKEYFSKAAENYEKAGKPHKAEWANSQAENAGMKEAA